MYLHKFLCNNVISDRNVIHIEQEEKLETLYIIRVHNLAYTKNIHDNNHQLYEVFDHNWQRRRAYV